MVGPISTDEEVHPKLLGKCDSFFPKEINGCQGSETTTTADIPKTNPVAFTGQRMVKLEPGFKSSEGTNMLANKQPCMRKVIWQYEYYLKDHLGNTRVRFADLDLNGSISDDEVLGEHHYYAFGLEMEGAWNAPTNQSPNGDGEDNLYRYNGMERNEELGLDLAVFRSYDPAIGRWLQVDPKAEAFTWASPYNSMLNNPISNIDPLGDTTRVYSMEGVLLRTINDSHANQDHFLTSGAMKIIEGNLDGAGDDIAGSMFRELS